MTSKPPADPADSTAIEALAMRWIEARPSRADASTMASAAPT
jgi:hypothetical protein